MSTLAESYFPPPQSWDAFEGLVLDVFIQYLNNPNLKIYGRQGQKQNGVDIAGLHVGGMVGIQCKNHPGGKITTSEIDAEIVKAESFSPQLAHYIIATSAPRDAEITKHVFETTTTRTEQGKFSVEIFFWEDILRELVRTPSLLKIHYPQLNVSAGTGLDQPKTTELQRRKPLVNHLLPHIARAQNIWDERLASDNSPCSFDHDYSHCYGAIQILEDVLKAVSTSASVQHSEIMYKSARSLLVRARDLMTYELPKRSSSVWKQYRIDGQTLITDVRAALHGFVKEQKIAEQKHLEEYARVLEQGKRDIPRASENW